MLPRLGVDHQLLQSQHGPCPLCGGKDRFRFDDKCGSGSYFCNKCGAGDGFALVAKLSGCSISRAFNLVGEALGGAHQVVPSLTVSPKIEQSRGEDRLAFCRNIWQDSKAVTRGDAVDNYLRARGIKLSQGPATLRYHPRLQYWSLESVQDGEWLCSPL